MKINDFSGGINNVIHPQNLKVNESVNLENVDVSDTKLESAAEDKKKTTGVHIKEGELGTEYNGEVYPCVNTEEPYFKYIPYIVNNKVFEISSKNYIKGVKSNGKELDVANLGLSKPEIIGSNNIDTKLGFKPLLGLPLICKPVKARYTGAHLIGGIKLAEKLDMFVLVNAIKSSGESYKFKIFENSVDLIDPSIFTLGNNSLLRFLMYSYTVQLFLDDDPAVTDHHGFYVPVSLDGFIDYNRSRLGEEIRLFYNNLGGEFKGKYSLTMYIKLKILHVQSDKKVERLIKRKEMYFVGWSNYVTVQDVSNISASNYRNLSKLIAGDVFRLDDSGDTIRSWVLGMFNSLHDSDYSKQHIPIFKKHNSDYDFSKLSILSTSRGSDLFLIGSDLGYLVDKKYDKTSNTRKDPYTPEDYDSWYSEYKLNTSTKVKRKIFVSGEDSLRSIESSPAEIDVSLDEGDFSLDLGKVGVKPKVEDTLDKYNFYVESGSSSSPIYIFSFDKNTIKDFNSSYKFLLFIPSLINKDVKVLSSFLNYPPPKDSKKLVFHSNHYFCCVKNKVYVSNLAEPNIWELGKKQFVLLEDVTNLISYYAGLVVTTENKTYLITGTKWGEFRLNTIDNFVGGIENTGVVYKQTPIWLNCKGLVSLQQGVTKFLTLLNFELYNNSSFKHEYKKCIATNFLGSNLNFYFQDSKGYVINCFIETKFGGFVFSLTYLDVVRQVFWAKNTILLNKSNGVYENEQTSIGAYSFDSLSNNYKELSYTSPEINLQSPTSVKYFNHVYIRLFGVFDVSFIIDGKTVSVIKVEKRVIETVDLTPPQVNQRGYTFQLHIKGRGKIYGIDIPMHNVEGGTYG